MKRGRAASGEGPDPASEAGELAAGVTIGPYRVDGRVGGGGVGTVYAATEPGAQKRVAIKVLRRRFADDPGAAARFEREARAIHAVQHPGIVEALSLGKLADGRPYLVMSLLEGRSLRAELDARGRLPPAEAWAALREVGEALSAAHRVGITHRDVKPENIFLEQSDGPRGARPRLLDFGLAAIEDTKEAEPPAKLTGAGVPVGTAGYMAPEQWWGSGVGAQTDQYALGMTLFEALAGRLPFAGARFAELMQQHLHESPATLADAGVAAAPAVEAFLARLLEKSAADRFASMDAALDAGDEAFGRDPPDSPPAPAPAPLAAPPAARARRGLAAQGVLLSLGLLGVWTLGYGGEARRDVGEWFTIAGWSAAASTALFLEALLFLPAAVGAAARRPNASPSPLLLSLALQPALSGVVGTYTGWLAIERAVDRAAPEQRLLLFNQGMYEANCSRFLGLSLSCLLLLSLGARVARLAPALPLAPRLYPLGPPAARAWLPVGGLATLALLSGLLGAPSGAFIALVGAAASALGLLAGPAPPRPPALLRAACSLLAVSLAIGVGLTRLEAREAYLWAAAAAGATRAERAAEILSASAERQATVVIAAAAFLVVALVERRRLAPRGARGTRAGGLLALLALTGAAALADTALHARFLATRARLRQALAPQFSLFARLDPPRGTGLDPGRFPPHAAPTLQVSTEAVALNGEGVARLSAIEAPEVTALVRAALGRATTSLADIPAPGRPDLSVCVDRRVPWGKVRRLLGIARGLGLGRVEILLTRGDPPRLSPRAPPEASFVVVTDFVALPAALVEQGLEASDEAPFGEMAAALLDRVRRGEPLALSAR